VGDIDQMKNKRAWIMIHPIPFMEVESAWARACAWLPPDDMDETEFFQFMDSTEMLDLTIPFSVQTPQWANYIPLTVNYTKRVGGQNFGMGRNGSICNASIHLATHGWREALGQPDGHRPDPLGIRSAGSDVDISHLVSELGVYTQNDRKRC
jgi:hypothetical protein